ncbi:hypothetical protein SBA4_2930019 [Candidatus Sulfopaludibacter sp. SbA4]|nr:hypothetical protein SBA4_2930019 [Candidatus Sulfopaludibacter sp. SbA4]
MYHDAFNPNSTLPLQEPQSLYRLDGVLRILRRRHKLLVPGLVGADDRFLSSPTLLTPPLGNVQSKLAPNLTTEVAENV